MSHLDQHVRYPLTPGIEPGPTIIAVGEHRSGPIPTDGRPAVQLDQVGNGHADVSHLYDQRTDFGITDFKSPEPTPGPIPLMAWDEERGRKVKIGEVLPNGVHRIDAETCQDREIRYDATDDGASPQPVLMRRRNPIDALPKGMVGIYERSLWFLLIMAFLVGIFVGVGFGLGTR